MRTLGFAVSMLVSCWSMAAHAQQAACDAAAEQKDLSTILQVCHEVAVAGDAHANFLMGYATLKTQTSYFSKETPSSPLQRVSSAEVMALEDAKGYLKNAADQGHMMAASLLGSVMLNTLFDAPNGKAINIEEITTQAFHYLKVAADAGDSQAILELANRAVLYASEPPHKVVQIYAEFGEYLRKTATDPETNTPYWQKRLRDFEAESAKRQAMQADVTSAPPEEVIEQAYVLRASGDPQQIQQGTAMLQALSDKGVGAASFILAREIVQKQGKDAALALMEKAGEQKSDKAMLWLGDYYGCHKQPKKALQWYEKAKAAGNKDADFGISEIKQYGNVADCG